MSDYPEPEWTSQNMNREKGDTTLKTCGWCEYTGSGTCRYNCYLSASCGLLPRYGMRDVELHWDTPCVIMMLGKKDLDDFISSKEREIQEYKNGIKDTESEIVTLKKLQSKVDNIPPLPNNRGCDDDFKNGEVVWVYHKKKWNRGIVVSGYRSGNGCVSYVLDDYPDSKGGWGCGVASPGVLKDGEFQYFKKHTDQLKFWLKSSDRSYNGKFLNMKGMYFALTGRDEYSYDYVRNMKDWEKELDESD